MAIIQSVQTINDEEVSIIVEVNEYASKEDVYTDLRDIKDKAIKSIGVAKNLIAEGFQLANGCAHQAVTSVSKLGDNVKPDEFELELAIKLDAEIGAILTNFGGEAQLKVNMLWKLKNE